MKLSDSCVFTISLTCVLLSAATNAAGADNPSWAEQQARNAEMQRQAMQQQHSQRGSAPQAMQYERWKQEWMQQHPGEPIPSFPVLMKMHRGEINNNINAGFNQMQQNRQAELQRAYQMARQKQVRELAAQNITWTPQQWADWNREYDKQMQQRAAEYSEAIRQSGEIARQEWLEEQRRKGRLVF